MESSDHIIDIGPEAGLNGGQIVAEGTVRQIIDNKNSITGDYLSGKKFISIPRKRRTAKNGRFIEKEILKWRNVRDTSGQETLRPVIITKLEISGRDYQVEICLQDRSKMKHRIILGRNFLRNGFIINPSRQYMHTMIRSIPRIIIDE